MEASTPGSGAELGTFASPTTLTLTGAVTLPDSYTSLGGLVLLGNMMLRGRARRTGSGLYGCCASVLTVFVAG